MPQKRIRPSHQKETASSHHPHPPTINKQVWKAGTLLAPVPAVLVTCMGNDEKPNIITIAWAGTVCSDPPMVSISVQKIRYSYNLIVESGAFVINLPTTRQARWTDYCGVASGRDVDKFAQTGFTPGPSRTVKPPVILECPINLECVVRQTIELGSHTLFIAEITATQISEDIITSSGRLAIEKANLFAFAHGGYYTLGTKLGHFGFSVKKRA